MDTVQKELLPKEMNEIKKFCCDCKTTKTPLWRAGPSGPKSLCNACGIRYRKKRSAVVGLNNRVEKKEEKSATTSLTNTNTAAAATTAAAASSIGTAKNRCGGGGSKGGNLSEDLRVRLVALGKEVVMLQRQRSPMGKRQRRRRRSVKRKLGEEEEQAAVLLMSLSCGFVFA